MIRAGPRSIFKTFANYFYELCDFLRSVSLLFQFIIAAASALKFSQLSHLEDESDESDESDYH